MKNLYTLYYLHRLNTVVNLGMLGKISSYPTYPIAVILKMAMHLEDPERTAFCGGRAGRWRTASRTVHDLGDPRTGRPIDLHVRYSTHRCFTCRRCFPADLSDLAPPRSHYTHRVQQTAVRLVVEDNLPYRMASWHLWRDHRVFVPWATIQNWVEAAGEKKPGRR